MSRTSGLVLRMLPLMIGASWPTLGCDDSSPATTPDGGDDDGGGAGDGEEIEATDAGDSSDGETPPQAEYPINLYFMIHLDPLATYRPPQPAPVDRYRSQRDNLQWLAEFVDSVAAGRGPSRTAPLAVEIGADHAQEYLADGDEPDDPSDGKTLLAALVAGGVHSLGTHSHEQLRLDDGNWTEASRTTENRIAVTQQHLALVDELVGAVVGSDDPTAIRNANAYGSGHLWDWPTAVAAGMRWNVGGGGEPLNVFFDHEAYNPWRSRAEEGFSGLPTADGPESLLAMGVPTTLGKLGRHLPHAFVGSSPDDNSTWIWQDTSVPAMKRKAVFLQLEWLYRVRAGLPPKVWLFGMTEHTGNLHGDDGRSGDQQQYRDEVEEFLTWLDANVIGRTTPDGHVVARWAAPVAVAAEFERWEAQYPGESSFSFPYAEIPWDGATDDDEWSIYPYALRGLARELMYSHYEEEVTGFPGAQVHRLTRVEVSTSPNAVPAGTGDEPWVVDRGTIVPGPGLPTRQIWVAWSETGEEVRIPTAELLGGPSAVAVDGVTGESTPHDGFVPLGAAPLAIRAP